jgi:hypothetical protein
MPGNIKLSPTLKLLLFLIFAGGFFIFAHTASAATYYLDATNGSDSNDGLAGTTGGGHGPWKTIAKVRATLIGDQPDTSILFKSGETWREKYTIAGHGTSGHQFYHGKYGSGANPIITGADLLNGTWTQKSDNHYVWSHTVSSYPAHKVWFNGVLGNKKSSIETLASDLDWYDDGSRLWIYSSTQANPNTVWNSPGIEIVQRDNAIMCDSDYVTFDSIDFASANISVFVVLQQNLWVKTDVA